MLKKIWIKLITNSVEKKRDQNVDSIKKRSNSIGLIYSIDQSMDDELIEDLVSDMKADGKQVSVLAFCKNKKNTSSKYSIFDSSDIGFFGKYLSDDLISFTEQQYEFAINLDQKRHYLTDYLFANLNAKCRVGITEEENRNHLEMILKFGNPIKSQEIIKYLKMIQSNEH